MLGSFESGYGPVVPSYQQCFQNRRSHLQEGSFSTK